MFSVSFFLSLETQPYIYLDFSINQVPLVSVTDGRCQNKVSPISPSSGPPPVCATCRMLHANHWFQGAPILNHYPPPPLKLKCRNVDIPVRFFYIMCCPPLPLTPTPQSLPLRSDSKWVTSDRLHWSPGWERSQPDNGEHVSVLGQALTCLTPSIWDAPTEKAIPQLNENKVLLVWLVWRKVDMVVFCFSSK